MIVKFGRIFCAIFFFLLSGLPVMAATYQVDKNKSIIEFEGKHAGQEFTGKFQKWDAKISFDPQNLAKSKVFVAIQMDSAKTGNAMYDGTLPTQDWFNTKKFPQAEFKSKSFTRTESGFNVQGDLTIRGITKTIAFDFNLSEKTPVIMTAKFPIHRLNFDIGRGSDEKSEWVSEIINMNLMITATQEE